MLPIQLTDAFQRQFSYLRLSLTELCNFKCAYCLPNGYQKPEVKVNELSLLEIQNLIYGCATAGFKKIRFTGGEPTLRPDLLNIIEAASNNSSIEKIALSTNGWNLKRIAAELKLAGVTHVNVSVDSLDPNRFAAYAGRNLLTDVLEGIDTAIKIQFQQVKINAVLHRASAIQDFELFLAYVKENPVSVRFIELMKTHDHIGYFDENFLSSGLIKQKLLSAGWKVSIRTALDGPAVEFSHSDYAGRIGVIAPHSEGFCSTCNRLRITSTGKLRLCLFGEENLSIREYLSSKELAAHLPVRIQELLSKKEVSHFIQDGRLGNVQNFSQMGG